MTDQIESLSFMKGRALHHVYQGAVVADEIHVDRRQLAGRLSQIGSQAERLQEYLGEDHRRPDVDIYAPGKTAHLIGKDDEVVMACPAGCRAVKCRVHMNRV